MISCFDKNVNLSNIDTEYNSEDSFEQLSNQPRHV